MSRALLPVSRVPSSSSASSVAVVGAGLAGLACARTLHDVGYAVTVFEKSRGTGGRCATRREGAWQFDHGAQYFTVRDPQIADMVASWEQAGVVAPWAMRTAVHEAGVWRLRSGADHEPTRFVGVPGMSAIGRALAEGLHVERYTTVSGIERSDSHWKLANSDGQALGAFDLVLVTAPAPQAASLLRTASPQLATAAAQATMHPTWATMLVLAEEPDLPWDAAFVNGHPLLAWVSRDASKPGRSRAGSWVVHATRAWSTSHLEDQREVVARATTAALSELLGVRLEPAFAAAHRWRYAIPDPVLGEPALFDVASGIGAAGDWCGGPRVEGALLSGLRLAQRVLSRATAPSDHQRSRA